MSLVEQLATIRRAVDQIMDACERIAVDIVESRRVGRAAEIDVSAAERAVDNAERLLRDAEQLLKTEGQAALQEAADRQRELGQQSDRMTEMSREAREHADRYNRPVKLRPFVKLKVKCAILHWSVV